MAIGKLYISYPKFNWDNYNSKLLDHNNLEKIILAKEIIDCHTTIHDMRYENMQRVIPAAKEIILLDLNIFNKGKSTYFFAKFLVYGACCVCQFLT
jgi:hypothetical protein